jgi:putative DNA primase/helicase
MGDPVQQFREALSRRGIAVRGEVIADGLIHRCDAAGKNGKGDAAYLLHLNGIPAGGFQNWRDGLGWEDWRADIGRSLTQAELAAQRAKAAATRREREAEQAKRHAEARKRATAILNDSQPARADHPYLKAKCVKAHGLYQYRDALVVPMRDADGELHSLQFIGADGAKRFLTGGRKQGCYFPIGKPDGVLCIVEGYATAASIFEATGYAVAVAFDCGNLEPVAGALRAKFLEGRLIICADDDAGTPGNPGLTKATAAARAVRGLVAVPDFGRHRPEAAKDFNDLALYRGGEAVREALNACRAPKVDDTSARGSVELICAASVSSEPIRWLWPEWLAAGKLHLIGGAPSTGKTTLALALAATLTAGGRWPDGSRCAEQGSVLIWSGEDGIADTLRPRLEAMGADLTRVHFVGRVNDAHGRRPFDPATDMRELESAAAGVAGLRMLIVDPVVSAVAGDSHKNAEVRRGLQPVVDFAKARGVAALGITHFSKGTQGRDPLERLTGSLAFAALARLAFAAAKLKDEDEQEYRVFVRVKNNVGPDGGGFRYTLEAVEFPSGARGSRILWGEAITGEAREILAQADAPSDDGEGGTLADAKRFLGDELAGGPLPTKTIRADADGAGYSWATMRRAKKALGIEVRKSGLRGGWSWALPPKMLKNPEDAQQKEVSTFGQVEHLRADDDPVEIEI